MWPVVSVPNEVGVELALDPDEREGHDDAPEALVLHRSNEALDDGDAAVLAERAVARADAVSSAPRAVRALKLHSLIGDDVLGDRSGVPDAAIEESADFVVGGLLFEDGPCDHVAGEVIDDDRDPGAKRPALRESLWDPWHPESEEDGHDGEVDVPDVVGSVGGDGSVCWFTASSLEKRSRKCASDCL